MTQYFSYWSFCFFTVFVFAFVFVLLILVRIADEQSDKALRIIKYPVFKLN